MKVYVIIENNEEEYEDYCEWIKEIYSNREKAEKRFIELLNINRKKKLKRIRYNENIGQYRLEKHELIV